MNRTFWPETASGPPIPRRLGVRYSYGDGPVKETTTAAVPNETTRLTVTRFEYARAAAVAGGSAAQPQTKKSGRRLTMRKPPQGGEEKKEAAKNTPIIDASLNGPLNDCARNTDDASRLRDLVRRGADLTSTNGAPWHHTPMHQAAYHNRPEMVRALAELCEERGVLSRILAQGSNPCGRGGSGTPMDLARGGGHDRVVDILREFGDASTYTPIIDGAGSSPAGQAMSRDSEPGVLSAHEIAGCWGCACLPAFAACEEKKAEGPDTLRHTGVCLPFCLPYSEVWDRVGRTNTFKKRGKEDTLHYNSALVMCFGPGITWRWCRK